MKIHLKDSKERRHYVIKHFDSLDARVETLYTGVFTSSNDKNVSMHKHNFLEIMFINDGKGTIEIENKKYNAKKGDIVIYMPNHLHREYSGISNPLKSLFFAIRYTSNLEILFEKLDTFCFSSLELESEFNNLFNLLIRESEKEDSIYFDKIVNALSKTIVFNILKLLNHGNLDNSNLSIRSIKEYLDIHYKEDISLDDLYSKLPISKFYIAKLFKNYYGTSPVNYLITKRIEEARNLLNNTNYKIGQISYLVGYRDIYYFTKIFKKEVGVTPSNYRKINHK